MSADDLGQQIDRLVGTQEIEQRKLLGDKRYDEIVERGNEREDATNAFIRSRVKIRDACAVAIGAAIPLGIFLVVGWSIWFWAR